MNGDERGWLAHVRPHDWVAPAPAGRYNLVVLGGGPAGLVAALGAAGLGAKVALVEKGRLGGDCLVAGCVPSKAVLAAAHAAQDARDARAYGVHATVSVDSRAVFARMREVRAAIAPHDSAERLRAAGVDVFFGPARFVDAERVEVGGQVLRFVRAVIATGARAAMPPIPGLAEAGALTNEELFELDDRPEALVVLGAGVIGCEMAQAFVRLGAQVTLIDAADRVLSREEPEASALVARRLVADGVSLRLGARVERVERVGEQRVVHLGDGTRIAGDALLVALGRRPNLDLDLERAGVGYTPAGVGVDDFLRTSNPRIYAAGDVVGQAAFTHAADHHARIVLRNALFPAGRARVSRLVIPRVTFTRPEVAAVGPAPDPAWQVLTVGLGDIDRGRTDGEVDGYARVYVDRGGRPRAATVVADAAGELLAPLTLAITHGLSMAALATTIHPYPTRSELVFKLASAWNKQRFTPRAAAVAGAWLAWQR